MCRRVVLRPSVVGARRARIEGCEDPVGVVAVEPHVTVEVQRVTHRVTEQLGAIEADTVARMRADGLDDDTIAALLDVNGEQVRAAAARGIADFVNELQDAGAIEDA